MNWEYIENFRDTPSWERFAFLYEVNQYEGETAGFLKPILQAYGEQSFIVTMKLLC